MKKSLFHFGERRSFGREVTLSGLLLAILFFIIWAAKNSQPGQEKSQVNPTNVTHYPHPLILFLKTTQPKK